MADDPLKYEALVERALKRVVRDVLQIVLDKGLPGDHHFYITFLTGHPEGEIPDYLRERYPNEMTIVLQNQFWGLEVEPERFTVNLSFGGMPHKLVVPYEAIVSFADPSVRFVLHFDEGQSEAKSDSDAAPATDDADLDAAKLEPKADQAPKDQLDAQDKVITLDSFRKR